MVMRVAKAERSPAMLGANGQAQQHMPSPHSPRRLSSVYTVAPEVGGCLEAERENQSAGPSLEEGVGRVQTGSWRSGAEFAMQTKDKYKFRGGNADPYQTVKGWLQRHLSLTRGVGLTKGLKAKGSEPVRVAWDTMRTTKSPLMASAKKPNKEIPKNRNK